MHSFFTLTLLVVIAPLCALAETPDPVIPVTPDAPAPFKAMKQAYNQGDLEGARVHADSYVRYMQKLMLEVRELSQLIGEALVRQGVVDEEDWVGVGQYLSKELAATRSAQGDPVGITADLSLEKIEPDPENRAEIYIFISPSSRYSREMGPDIERMRRLAQRDPKLKLGVYTIGTPDPVRAEAFRRYTGIQGPIQDGTALAKQFRVAFVPTVVVRAPSSNRLYLRTGALTIARLVEFVRTVQGAPRIVSDSEFAIIEAKVGIQETEQSESNGISQMSFRTEGQSGAPSLEKF